MRTKLGLTLVSEKPGEKRIYRIVAKDALPKRKSKLGRKGRDRMPRTLFATSPGGDGPETDVEG